MVPAKETLDRDDIVGKRIANIYQTRWDVDEDGYGSSSAYVQLESGVAFELQSDEFGVAHPIFRIDIEHTDATPVTDGDLRRCIGEKILEVLACDLWPGIGLHISNDYLIVMQAFPYASAWYVGPSALPIGHVDDFYKLSDTVSYFQQSK